MRSTFLLFFTLIIASCANEVSKVNQDNDTLIQEHGYLLLAVDTNVNLHEIYLSGEEYVKLTAADLRAGSNYLLVMLPAGKYELNKIKSNRFVKFDNFEEDLWSFQVKKGVISYVGHLTIKTVGFWSSTSSIIMLNKSSMALEFLEENYQNILSNRKLEYWGPGNDDFFNFVLSTASNEEASQ